MRLLLSIVIIGFMWAGAQSDALRAEEGERVDLQFFGDVFLPHRVLQATKTTSRLPMVFSDTSYLLESADINIINLEGAVTTAFVPYRLKSYLLKMPLEVPEILRTAGVHAVVLANNHLMDFGPQGLFDTLALLEESGIATVGAGNNLEEALRPLYFDTNAGKVCILAFSRSLPASFYAKTNRPGTASVSFTDTATMVHRCVRSGHITIPVFHWGEERTAEPKLYQRKLAQVVINAGATAVIGHHPHVLQKIEVYRGRPIFYSLGNYAFGTKPYAGVQTGMAVRIKLSQPKGSLATYELVPLNVNNKEVEYIPRPLKAGEEDTLRELLPAGRYCSKIKNRQVYACRFH